MLLPIGISIIQAIKFIKNLSEDQKLNFQVCLLRIAYSSSLGGITTPIGTVPNGVLIQYAFENYNLDIGFMIGFNCSTFSIIFINHLVGSNKILFPINFSDTGSAEKFFEIKEELGVMSREEKIVFLYFCLLLWDGCFENIDDLPFSIFTRGCGYIDDGWFSLNVKSKRLLDWEDIKINFLGV